MTELGEPISSLSFNYIHNQFGYARIVAVKVSLKTTITELLMNLVEQDFGRAQVIADCADGHFDVRSCVHVPTEHRVVLGPSSLAYDDSDRKMAMCPLDFSKHQAKEIVKYSILIFFRVVRMEHNSITEACSYGYVHFDRILSKFAFKSVLMYYAWHRSSQRKYLRSPVHNISYVS